MMRFNEVTLKAAKKSNVYGFATGKAVNLSIGKISGANLFGGVGGRAAAPVSGKFLQQLFKNVNLPKGRKINCRSFTIK